MLQEFQHYIQTTQLFDQPDPILLAVSGGIDSVVLAHLFKAANCQFGIAHCNFQLRGAESDGDATFVQELALELDVPYFQKSFETAKYAEEQGVSIQMAARDLRYEWLEALRQEQNYKFIATAHHQDDLMETVLFNLTKGTGIAGLHGILIKNGKIIRPLLAFDKAKISHFAQENQIAFREDASNAATKYHRNKIRHQVIPTLKEINPSVVQTFYENTQRFLEVEMIYKEGVERLKKQLIKPSSNRVDRLISIKQLLQMPYAPTILFELLRDYDFNNKQVKQLLQTMEKGEAGKVFYSPSHRLIVDRTFLILSEKKGESSDFHVIIEGQTTLKLPNWQLQLESLDKADFVLEKSPQIACLDQEKLVYPLVLRRWKKGDYFYPFGMNHKKKKLSRFFIDQKMSLLDKERIWVLEDQQKRIVWVVGKRIDERFCVRGKTERVLVVRVG